DKAWWYSVSYGNGLFVAVGSSGDRVMTSSDGITWTVRSAAGDNDAWQSVTYGNGLFVAVGWFGGDRVMTSPDGITWTARSAAGDDDNWNSITYGNGFFVAVGSSNDNRVMTSPDGITWTARSAAGDDDAWSGVTYGNGLFVAVGSSGDRVMIPAVISLTAYNPLTTNVFTNLNNSYSTLISTSTFTITEDFTNNGHLDLADTALTVQGNYTNNGTLVASTSEIIFAGTTQQTATGTLSASSSLYDLTITNTSGSGSTTQSVIFGAPITTTGTFTMVASTSAQFLAGATSTFENVDWLGGGAESPVWLRSSGDTIDWYLDIPGSRLNVQYVDVKSANAGANSSGVVYAFNSVDAGNNTNWDFDPQIGSSTISNHDSDQVDNAFSSQSATAGSLFAFKLTPETGDATVSNLVLSLVGVKKITTGNFSNLKLYRDHNSDGVYDAGDEQVGGAGAMQIDGQYGTITFSADFAATTSQNYLVVGDWSVGYGAAVTLRLPTSGVTTIDAVTYQQIFGAVDPVLHDKNEKSTKGVSIEIGGGAPTGREVLSGGTNDGGEQIGDDPDFKWPTGHSGIWSGMAYAYDQVDGTYAAAFESFMTASYLNHYLIIPGSNSIQGIEVKLEVSGTTAAGDIDVDLSWDGGTTWTTIKTTPTLTTTDTVVSLGGPSDTWGRAWTASEFSNTNFVVRLDANPSSNNVQVDAIQVRVYHQAGGGGAGGGGGGGAI
ncbi:hypothetical protein KC926_02875, partial [Candidatus Kaiserbacteria bacterium]|nr:hypothetical protein [Candidatus Kaiserbacteria bacterium]